MATKPTTPKPPRAPAKRRTPTAKLALVGDEMPVDTTEGEGPVKGAAGLRLKGLVDMVSASTSVKKKDVKTVIEAVLIQMAEALKRGDALNLTGLGRMRVAKAGDAGGAMTLKLRMGGPSEKAEKASADPLADDEDQD